MEPFREVDHYEHIFPNNEYLHIAVPRRTLRDAQDPYDLSVMDFKKRYRFSQYIVRDIILPLVADGIRKNSDRGQPIAPAVQILVCLRFYATGSFQIVCGDLLHISQPSVSRIVSTVSRLLALLCDRYIKYPEDIIAHRLEFYRLGQIGQRPGLPEVEGAIDCTHIKIIHTPGVANHEAFRNRKSFFSVNTQAVVGPRGQFIDIVARWAGSTHDSRILQLSSINLKYRDGQHTGVLIGDNGYPSLPYLLTPILNPTQPSEERYNRAHIKTRNVVERAFGMWKRRFPCLSRGLGNKIETVANIIVACAVLHNISLTAQDTMPEDGDEEIHNDDINTVTREGSADGFAFRNAIVNRFV